MDLERLRALFDQHERINIIYPDARREATPQIVRHVNMVHPHSYVLYTHIEPADVDRVIDEQITYYASLGHQFEWKTYAHDMPPDMPERLAQRGFEIEDIETVMVLDLAAMPESLSQRVTHDVRKITSADTIRSVFHAVQQPVFGDTDEEIDRFADNFAVRVTKDPDALSIYAAYEGEQPVSAAWITFAGGSVFAGLWGGSTLEAYRGRGFYTALVATRAQEAVRRGCRYLCIDASPMSRPIVAKNGFFQLTTTTPCQWQPSES